MKRDDVVGAGGDDLTRQVTFVGEVVRELRPADADSAAHVVQADPQHAVVEHQLSGALNDACPRRQSLAREPLCAVILGGFEWTPVAWPARSAGRPLDGVGGEHAQVVHHESQRVGQRPLLAVGERDGSGALVGGHDDQCQLPGVRLCRQGATVLHVLERLFEEFDPPRVTGRQSLARRIVGLGKLSRQSVISRSSVEANSPQVAHIQIDPALEVVEGLQATELGLPMKIQDNLNLARNNGPDQRLLVSEIVSEL
jgi:hypothetical protein